MFANFTEETCTGTGDLLTLTGATPNNIPFSASFADGALVSIALVDSAGVIKVAGIYTYNAGNTFARNDTWNYNGTVVDNNPAANITLSAGTHTIRCDASAKNLRTAVQNSKRGYYKSAHWMGNTGIQIFNASANRLYMIPFLVATGEGKTASAINAVVTTAGTAAARIRIGFATAKLDGNAGRLLYDSGELLASSTGFKSATLPMQFNDGWCYALLFSNEAVSFDAVHYNNIASNPLLGCQYTGDSLRSRVISFKDTPFSAFPALLPAPSGDADLSTTPMIWIKD